MPSHQALERWRAERRAGLLDALRRYSAVPSERAAARVAEQIESGRSAPPLELEPVWIVARGRDEHHRTAHADLPRKPERLQELARPPGLAIEHHKRRIGPGPKHQRPRGVR